MRYQHLRLADEPASLEYFVADMRRFYAREDGRRAKFSIKGKSVCTGFYHAAMGISNSKLDNARCKAKNGSLYMCHGNTGKVYATDSQASERVTAFWHVMYDSLCQIISNSKRLRPHNLVMEDVYDEIFVPTMKQHYPNKTVPSLSCFIRGSRSKDFSDVTKQVKHNHCKCTTCFELTARKLKAFKSEEDMREVIAATRAHEQEVKQWRETENYWFLLAQHSPHTVNVFMADDTSAAQFPHTGSRPTKATANIQGVNITPWLVEDVSRCRKTYMYTPKKSYDKGGNRWCTQMFQMIKSLKMANGSAARARKCVMIFDNASDNKNNVNLAFASHLVMRGWYDEVEILFGPVGHTHNGIDAVHKIHNQGLGRYFCATLAEWVNRYE
jgi:hypothetical protein